MADMEEEALENAGSISNPFYTAWPDFSPENATTSSNNLRDSDQGLRWGFSTLKLSDDFRSDASAAAAAAHVSSYCRTDEPCPLWLSSGGIWNPFSYPQQQSSTCSNRNWAIGSGGAHGTGEVLGLWGRSSYIDDGDHCPSPLLEWNQGQGCLGANFDNYGSSLLHGREFLSVAANSRLRLPSFSPQPSNFFFSSECGTQKPNRFDFNTMRGKIVPLAKNQDWCIALCSILENGVTMDEIEAVLPEIVNNLGDLMENQFGSRFIKTLFQRCSRDQKTRIVNAVTRFRSVFLHICLNQHGVKAVHKILELLDTPLQVSMIVVALIPDACVLATDTNGQHVIEYCVKNFHRSHTADLIAKLTSECFEIATSRSGCCVLQSCMENCDETARDLLIREILANARSLAEDPYGNYVVQCVIGLNISDATADLLRAFKGSFTALSRNKYASNVVEAFLKASGEAPRAEVIRELLASHDGSSLLTDPFGNYVIQTALQVSKGHECNALMTMIERHAPSMHRNLYGKKILASVEKMKQTRAA